MLDNLKIAIVCDWLTVYAGAERVVHQMHQLFPDTPIFTTLYDPKRCSAFERADVRESWLGKIPGARRFHRLLLPLMPKTFESMNLDEFDIVISSSHSCAKGIITRPETLHVTYCHSPMRYVWDHSHEYQRGFRRLSFLSFLYRPLLHRIRIWDRLASERVDRFLVNSKYIQKRVSKYYARPSEVITPPVDLSAFQCSEEKGDYYLAVGRLIPYKRFDLAIEASNKLGFKLNIVGLGPELSRLKRMAGPQVSFLGHVSQEELRDQYQHARGLIFPQLEDFGIVPLEAMACGTPVLAYGAGGALETVSDGVSGLFFKEQAMASLTKAFKKFDRKKWKPDEVAESVQRFSPNHFRMEFLHFVEDAWKQHQKMLS